VKNALGTRKGHSLRGRISAPLRVLCRYTEYSPKDRTEHERGNIRREIGQTCAHTQPESSHNALYR